MSTTTRLQRRLPAVAFVAAMVIVAGLVTRTSQAAFTATTSNTGNSFSAAAVTLTDNAASALFSVTGLEPGDTATGCIEVTYTGDLSSPQAVKIYSNGYTDTTGGLSAYLQLTVNEGAAGATCATFTPGTNIVAGDTLAAFGAASSAYASGVGGWIPAGSPETRAYEFSVTLDTNTPNTEQGSVTNGVGFVWEIQS